MAQDGEDIRSQRESVEELAHSCSRLADEDGTRWRRYPFAEGIGGRIGTFLFETRGRRWHKMEKISVRRGNRWKNWHIPVRDSRTKMAQDGEDIRSQRESVEELAHSCSRLA